MALRIVQTVLIVYAVIVGVIIVKDFIKTEKRYVHKIADRPLCPGIRG